MKRGDSEVAGGNKRARRNMSIKTLLLCKPKGAHHRGEKGKGNILQFGIKGSCHVRIHYSLFVSLLRFFLFCALVCVPVRSGELGLESLMELMGEGAADISDAK